MRKPWVAVGIAGVIFVQGWLRGEELRLLFLTMVSLAVAIIPEGLPAVVTITLALGAQRMLKRQALIRKLPAVETLGSVTVICSDKTGTLTENRMTVTVLDVAGHRLDLTESFRHHVPALDMTTEGHLSRQQHPVPFTVLLAGSALCNDAVLHAEHGLAGRFHAIGDPTEGALVVAAAQLGVWKADLDQALPRIAELPFDSERKRMTTVHRLPHHNQHPVAQDQPPSVADDATTGLPVVQLLASLTPSPYVAFTKGAVDGLLEVTTHVWVDDHITALDLTWRRRIADANEALARNGMRVLGVACRTLDTVSGGSLSVADTERDLTFLGLVGMIDPPRPEVQQAVHTCQRAGIRPVMITGDHPLTHIPHPVPHF